MRSTYCKNQEKPGNNVFKSHQILNSYSNEQNLYQEKKLSTIVCLKNRIFYSMYIYNLILFSLKINNILRKCKESPEISK